PDPPNPDRYFDRHWLEALLVATPPSNEHRFLQLMRQLVVEFDALGESPQSRSLLAFLDGVQLVHRRRDGGLVRRTVRASDFLREAARVLREGEEGVVEMPESWPGLAGDSAAALASTLSAAMRERFRSVKGRPGRFD